MTTREAWTPPPGVEQTPYGTRHTSAAVCGYEGRAWTDYPTEEDRRRFARMDALVGWLVAFALCAVAWYGVYRLGVWAWRAVAG